MTTQTVPADQNSTSNKVPAGPIGKFSIQILNLQAINWLKIKSIFCLVVHDKIVYFFQPRAQIRDSFCFAEKIRSSSTSGTRK